MCVYQEKEIYYLRVWPPHRQMQRSLPEIILGIDIRISLHTTYILVMVTKKNWTNHGKTDKDDNNTFALLKYKTIRGSGNISTIQTQVNKENHIRAQLPTCSHVFWQGITKKKTERAREGKVGEQVCVSGDRRYRRGRKTVGHGNRWDIHIHIYNLHTWNHKARPHVSRHSHKEKK